MHYVVKGEGSSHKLMVGVQLVNSGQFCNNYKNYKYMRL